VPVAIVCILPVGYTELYARQFNEICAPPLSRKLRKETSLALAPSWLAPAGSHMTLQRQGNQLQNTSISFR